MKRIFYHQPDFEGQGFWRAQLPVKHCKAPLAEEGIELTLDSSLTSLDYDAFVFHRLLKAPFLPVIEQIRRQGKTVVWELDDDLWHIPAWNPASRAYDASALEVLDWTRDQADAILVSTPELAQVVDRPDKTWIAPNLIDADLWPEVQPRDDNEVRVLWAGSVHHERDLEEVVPAVEDLLADYPQVKVFFFGDMPASMAQYVRIKYSHLAVMAPHDRYAGRVGFVQPVPTGEYVDTLCAIQPDIALCPLCDDPFNYSKSNIKWLEMSMAGAAVVATDLPPYRCIRHEDDGLLVRNGAPSPHKRWDCCLYSLVESDSLRQALAARARRRVLADYSWRSPAKEIWLEAFRRMVDTA